MAESIPTPLPVVVSVTTRSDTFSISDAVDITKTVDFELSNITTGTTRTIIVPNSDCVLSALSSKNLVTGKSSVPSGDSNTLHGYNCGSDVTTGSKNTLVGSELKAGSSSAVNRILIGEGFSGTYDNTFHLSSSITRLHLPGLLEIIKTKVLYFDPLTSLVTMGDLPTTDQMAAGNVSAPGIKFSVDTDTGIYHPAINTIGMVAGGAEVMKFNTQACISVDGTASAPGLVFSSETNSGLYRLSSNSLGMAINGSLVSKWGAGQFLLLDGTASAPAFGFSSASTTGFYYNSGIAYTVAGTLAGIMKSAQFLISSTGSVSAPALAINSTDTGFYKSAPNIITISLGGTASSSFAQSYFGAPAGDSTNPGLTFKDANTMGFYQSGGGFIASVGGTQLLDFKSSTSYMLCKTVLLAQSGAVSLPGFTFEAAQNYGMYYNSGLHFAVNGSAGLSLTTSAATFAGPLRLQNGNAGAPAVSFTSATTTGMYYDGTYLRLVRGSIDFLESNSSTTSVIGNLRVKGTSLIDSSLLVANTSGVDRFRIFVSGSESGGNTGSNLMINSLADDGATPTQSGALQINRANGKVSFGTNTLFVDGSESNPGISFSADQDTGIYRNTTNNLSVACGGTKIATFTSSTAAFYGNVTSTGSFTGGGADYAEFFESNEVLDVGDTVVLDGQGFIRKSRENDDHSDIIGVVRPKTNSVMPLVIGNARLKQTQKTDDYGRFLETKATEHVQLIASNPAKKLANSPPFSANPVMPQAVSTNQITSIPTNSANQTISPAIPTNSASQAMSTPTNPEIDREYLIGLLGQIPVKKIALKNLNWKKIKTISKEADLYLVK